jgi:hypothetical protein
MTDHKPHKQPTPKIVVGPKSSTGNVAMMPDTVPSQDRIRVRAYELYVNRGREPGRDEQDWFCAEQEILKRKR